MTEKEVLLGYLRAGRTDLLAKIDGLDEYDARRPMTPTGTNLLGLIKHVASVELGYFTEVFGEPMGRDVPWIGEDAREEADMWVPVEQSRAEIIELHHFSAARSDAMIEALPLETVGEVPWWNADRRQVTLQQILVHMIAETARHAGHADILRELIDGSVGHGPNDPNIADRSTEEWAQHRARTERHARLASGA